MWDQEMFAARLRFMVRTRGTTQTQLCRKLRIANWTFSHWLTGATESPGLHILDSVALELKTNPCWLAFGCAEHEPPEWAKFLEELKRRNQVKGRYE